jgi:hypothetical protein
MPLLVRWKCISIKRFDNILAFIFLFEETSGFTEFEAFADIQSDQTKGQCAQGRC